MSHQKRNDDADKARRTSKAALPPGLPTKLDSVLSVTSSRRSKPAFRSVSFGPTVSGTADASGRSRGPRIPRPTSFAGGPLSAPSPAGRGVKKAGSATMPPPPAFPPPLGRARSPMTSIAATRPSTRLSSSSSSSSSRWSPHDSDLIPVPRFYPLEKTSRRVVGTSAAVISSRVADCCRVLGIQVSFREDEEEAGGGGDSSSSSAAVLTTHDGVGMRLNLWRGRKERGLPGEGGVVTEVRRSFGDAARYHTHARCILQAAEGEFDVDDHRAQMDKERSRNEIAKRVLGNGIELLSEHASEGCAVALETSSTLLKTGKADAAELALQSLVYLFDPEHSGYGTATVAATTFLSGDTKPEIRDAVLSLLLCGCLVDGDCGNEPHRHLEDHPYMGSLQSLCLAVLAKAVSTLATSSSIGETQDLPSSIINSFLVHARDKFGKDLLRVLLDKLGNTQENIHDACLAAQCLRSLCDTSGEARHAIREAGAEEVTTSARGWGERYSTRLEGASEQLFSAVVVVTQR